MEFKYTVTRIVGSNPTLSASSDDDRGPQRALVIMLEEDLMTDVPDALALQHYLHERIVQSKSMGVAVAEVSPERVVLTAPLAPNINVHGTVFGGSVSSVAMLAAWSLLHTLLKTHDIPAELVIHSSHVEFRAPIKGEFRATAAAPDADTWSSFEHMLARKGRARIKVGVDVEFADVTAAYLEGTFVAVNRA